MNKNDFTNEEQILKWANTTKLVRLGKIIQVQHFQTHLFHYMISRGDGWYDSGMTSFNGILSQEES